MAVSPNQTVALVEDLTDLDWSNRDLVQEAVVACLAHDEAEAATVRRAFDAVFLGQQDPRRARRVLPSLSEGGGAAPSAPSPLARPTGGPRRPEPEGPAERMGDPAEPRPRTWEKPGHSRRPDGSPPAGQGAGAGHPGDSVQAFVKFVRQRASAYNEPGRSSADPQPGSAQARGAGTSQERGRRSAAEGLPSSAMERLASHASEWFAQGLLDLSVAREIARLGPEARPFLLALRAQRSQCSRHSVERRRLEQALRELALALHDSGAIKASELASALTASTHGLADESRLSEERLRTEFVGQAVRDIEVLRDVVQEYEDRQGELPSLIAQLCEALRLLVARRSAQRQRAAEGRISLSHTLRASVEYCGLPMELRMTERRREVDLLLFLDTSGSQLWWAGAALLAGHALGRVSGRLQAFTFASEIADAARFLRCPQAFFEDLRAFGGASDYQRALDHLLRQARITTATTVLVVGDCRDYQGHWETRRRQGITERVRPESATLMARLASQSRRVVVLNPEPKADWGTGDSAALHYQAAGAQVFPVRSPLDIAERLSRLVR